jgi:hypothetical protein
MKIHAFIVQIDVTLNVTLSDSPWSDGRAELPHEHAPSRKRGDASK